MKRYFCWHRDPLGKLYLTEFDNAIDAQNHAEATDTHYFEYKDRSIDPKRFAVEQAIMRYLGGETKHIKVLGDDEELYRCYEIIQQHQTHGKKSPIIGGGDDD